MTSIDTFSLRMDTESGNNDNPNLEVEYLLLLGSAISRCVEELLVISYRSLKASTKENYHRTTNDYLTADQVRIVIEHSCLTSVVSTFQCLERNVFMSF